MPVAFVNSLHDSRHRLRLGTSADDAKGMLRTKSPPCVARTPLAARSTGLSRRPARLRISKTRYSPFWDTDIAERLKTQGVDTLVLAGLTTECCIDSTARDAFNHDFHVFVARDACAAYEPDLHTAALRMLDLNTAILTDAESVVGAWS